MSYKNIFSLKKNANTDGVYSLNNFDPKINIEKINKTILKE